MTETGHAREGLSASVVHEPVLAARLDLRAGGPRGKVHIDAYAVR